MNHFRRPKPIIEYKLANFLLSIRWHTFPLCLIKISGQVIFFIFLIGLTLQPLLYLVSRVQRAKATRVITAIYVQANYILHMKKLHLKLKYIVILREERRSINKNGMFERKNRGREKKPTSLKVARFGEAALRRAEGTFREAITVRAGPGKWTDAGVVSEGGSRRWYTKVWCCAHSGRAYVTWSFTVCSPEIV